MVRDERKERRGEERGDRERACSSKIFWCCNFSGEGNYINLTVQANGNAYQKA